MKLHILSDLHLEFAPFDIPRTDADLIVLAGDIAVGTAGVRWARAWARKLGKPVVYVLGNHEYYQHVFPDLVEDCRREAARSNVHVLENDVLELGEVRILCATLWTDLLYFGPQSRDTCAWAVEKCLMDYRAISEASGRRLRIETVTACHERSRAWLEQELARPWVGRTVVVTHHAVVREANHPHFNGPQTAGFVSDLSGLIAAHDIDLWVSGHTHANVDLHLHGTRILSNQRGYLRERVPGAFRADLVVEV